MYEKDRLGVGWVMGEIKTAKGLQNDYQVKTILSYPPPQFDTPPYSFSSLYSKRPPHSAIWPRTHDWRPRT